MSICEEAKKELNKMGEKLTSEQLDILASYTPKQQMQWLVNPGLMRIMAPILRGMGGGGNNVSTKQTVKTDKVPKPVSDEEESEESSAGGFGGLFD